MANPNTFICAQAAALEQLIIEYQNAALDLAQNKIQSFSFDTGQTKETVTKASVKLLQDTTDQLYNRYVVLCNRCTGQNVVIARPCW